MSLKLSEFLTKAEHCEHLAEQVDNQTLKATYKDLARQWRYMAREIELLETEIETLQKEKKEALQHLKNCTQAPIPTT
jgi:hypothetical protein